MDQIWMQQDWHRTSAQRLNASPPHAPSIVIIFTIKINPVSPLKLHWSNNKPSVSNSTRVESITFPLRWNKHIINITGFDREYPLTCFTYPTVKTDEIICYILSIQPQNISEFIMFGLIKMHSFVFISERNC